MFNLKELNRKAMSCFPKAFINEDNEMIIYPRRNTGFLLKDIKSKEEYDCKILEWCSREASKGTTWQSRKYHKEGMKNWFNKEFSQYELDLIYQYLGNCVHHDLSLKYIRSNLDISILESK